jgi:hypothetical protein
MKFGPEPIDGRYRSPYFIGLVGHRKIREVEIPKIQEEFDQVVGTLLGKLENTPIIVLTAIAEGADRIAFTSKFRNRILICAVLPFRETEYSRDFTDIEQKEEFQRALSESDYVLTLGKKLVSKKINANERKIAYRDCGRWISDNSNLFIAIWNGRAKDAIGGTSDIIDYRLGDVHSRTHKFQHPVNLIHISASNGQSQATKECTCEGHQEFSSHFYKSLKNLDSFNSKISAVEYRADDSQFQVYFRQFDENAVKLHKKYIRRSILLLLLGVTTANVAGVQQENFRDDWFLYTALFLSATLIYWRTFIIGRYKAAYELFRFIAEVLRVQVWWEKCGLDSDDITQFSEFEDLEDSVHIYLSNVFLFANIYKLDSSRGRTLKVNTEVKISSELWLEDQITYLSGVNGSGGAIQNMIARNRKLRRTVIGFLSSAALAIIISTLLYDPNGDQSQSLEGWIYRLAFPFFLSLAAVTAAYRHAMGFGELRNRYELKLRKLEVALAQLKRTDSQKTHKEIVGKVGTDSLLESLRWFQLKSEREVRPFQ